MNVIVEYTDTPMGCCGLGMAYGFSNPVRTGGNRMISGTQIPEYRNPTKADVLTRLELAKERANDETRNCVLISLSSAQITDEASYVDIAREAGFKVIHEFFNPNSDNVVYIMEYTKYANRQEFLDDAGWAQSADDESDDWDDEE